MQYDPFLDLESRAGVIVISHSGPQEPWGEVLGLVTFSTLTVSLRTGMAPHEFRCTLAHELVHLERGPIRPSQRAGEERAIRLIVAKRLVDPEACERLMGADRPPTLTEIHQVLRVDFDHFRAYAMWRLGRPGADAVRAAPLDGLSVPWPPAWMDPTPGR